MVIQPGSTKHVGKYMVSIGRRIGDFSNSYIYIRNTKTGKSRTLGLMPNRMTVGKYKRMNTVKQIKASVGGYF